MLLEIKFFATGIFSSHNPKLLLWLICVIDDFLKTHLRLQMHPKKVFLLTIAGGIDFVGYVHFLHHRLVRPQTKRRLKRKLNTALKLFQRGKISCASLDQSAYLLAWLSGGRFLCSYFPELLSFATLSGPLFIQGPRFVPL